MPASTDSEIDIGQTLVYGTLGLRGTRWVIAFDESSEALVDAYIEAFPRQVYRIGSTQLVFETRMPNDWAINTRTSYVFKPAPVPKRDSPLIRVDTSIPTH